MKRRGEQPSKLAFLLLCVLVGCSRGERWNVVVATFDTTRADHIGCYGNASASTPVVDALAAEGFLFENAHAAIPITMPSHSTIMTGLVPMRHGVRDNGLFVLPAGVETLAERLRSAGYATGAAVGSFPLTAKFGLDQGFDLYDDRVQSSQEDFRGRKVRAKQDIFFDERRAQRVNEAIYPWLEEVAEAAKPFFLWVHYYDPHQPLQPPPPYDQLFADDLYAGEIAYADESLGTLFDELRRLGVWDRTLVVFTADHGEGMGEHRERTHSYLLYETTLHVPLIVRAPGGFEAPRRITERVHHVDIVPTVLDLLGLERPPDLDGRSLVPYLRGERPSVSNDYAETLSPGCPMGGASCERSTPDRGSTSSVPGRSCSTSPRIPRSFTT
ncbi:MAG: sulfatase [Thermoanaerobaculia bacterium]